ncbi:GL22740 [Drosophila persimilis]|uniref:Uncharacterized protein n=2 Tax=pseudoobscura subgroup TaxID=32358 RepID=Q2LZ13_DROPS|nr:uncharacterized protein LOC4813273 [Drosophila pseudoobscura]XP_002024100.1 uncharacterized protein LOC6598895 [Drosophila persimilis]EDW29498.1 GL22740 [Drosophila persimilis]
MYKAACLVLALCAVASAVPSAYDTEHVWKAGNLSYPFPNNAILGGFDPYGYNIYIGRVKFGTTIVPARVVAETGVAYFNNQLTASKATTYDILVIERDYKYVWVRSFDGLYEFGSVAVGTSNFNERVFMCRAKTDGGLLIGMLMLSEKLCIIKHETLALRKFDKYEVLVALPKNGTIY